MATTCDNRIVIGGPAATVAVLTDTLAGRDSFSVKFPLSMKALANRYGETVPTWYGGHTQEETTNGLTRLTLEVETSWQPADQLVAKLAAEHPELEIEIVYLELEQGYAGVTLFRDGAIVGSEFAWRSGAWIESIITRFWPKWLPDVQEVFANGDQGLWHGDLASKVVGVVAPKYEAFGTLAASIDG